MTLLTISVCIRKIQCQCAVILTEEDNSRVAMFADILNRLSQFIPKSLQRMVNSFHSVCCPVSLLSFHILKFSPSTIGKRCTPKQL